MDGNHVADSSGSANYGESITSFTTTGVITLSFAVIDKDGGSSSDTAQITISEPLHGAASINADGMITYQPAAAVVDDDSFRPFQKIKYPAWPAS